MSAYCLSTGYPAALVLAFIISICVMLSTVDIVTRKIPNVLLLALIVLAVATFVINDQASELGIHIVGAVLGLAVFLLPALFGKGAGLGDVKFAAIVGLFLGAYDFFAAVILMTLFLLIYTAYLVVTKKGGLKTQVALGPFLAKENGQAVVEMALVLPLLLLILCGIIDYGWIMTNQNAIDNSARDGARYAIVHAEDTSAEENIINYTKSVIPSSMNESVTVDVTFTDPADPRAGDVLVKVSSDVTVMTPIAGIFTGGQVVALDSVCQMKVE